MRSFIKIFDATRDLTIHVRYLSRSLMQLRNIFTIMISHLILANTSLNNQYVLHLRALKRKDLEYIIYMFSHDIWLYCCWFRIGCCFCSERYYMGTNIYMVLFPKAVNVYSWSNLLLWVSKEFCCYIYPGHFHEKLKMVYSGNLTLKQMTWIISVNLCISNIFI